MPSLSPTWLYLSAFLLFAIPITFFDLLSFRIPNILTFTGIAVFFTINMLLNKESFGLLCMEVFIGFGLFWLIFYFTKGKMGLGDAKYSALIAVAAGLYSWLASIFIASIIALITALFLIVILKKDRKTKIPFAPFLTVGASVAILFKGFHDLIPVIAL